MEKLKVLVTGGAGFIGSNIADAFIAKGHNVTVIDNLSSGKRSNINRKAKFYIADISDYQRLRIIFNKEKFDTICHHAAQIDVRKSVSDPANDARVNIVGTLNLLECARETNVKKVIFASSGGTIYGECSKTAPKENSPANPLSPYGIAKHSVEFYLKYYAYTYGIKFTSLRYGNVYGPRQDPHGEAGVVAIFSERVLHNEELLIFGTGEQTRDYVYVADVVRANLKALTRGHNNIINIGTGKLTSVNTLFRIMAQISAYKKKPIYKPARTGELSRSFLDIRAAASLLGWKPQVSIEQGLKNTMKYFEGSK